MITLNNLITEVAKQIQMGGIQNYKQEKIPQFINRKYEEIWRSYDWPNTKTKIQITQNANEDFVILDKRYEAILAIEQDGKLISVTNMGQEAFLNRTNFNSVWNTNSIQTRDVTNVELLGVKVEFTPAETLKIDSSNTGDTSVSLLVKGQDANGETITETITTNASDGTTQVTTVNSLIPEFIAKSVTTAGIITLYRNDGTTVLATLGQNETSSRYRKYVFGATPTTATTYNVIVRKNFEKMVKSEDTPAFEMKNALIYGAVTEALWEMRNEGLAATFEQKFRNAVAQLIAQETEMNGQMTLMQPMARA